MAGIWYYFEDLEYLKEEEIKSLGNPEPILTKKELEEKINKVLKEKKNVISPLLPPSELEGIFEIKELPNKYNPFTTQQIEYINSFPKKEREKVKEKLLEKKIGIRIMKPQIKLSKLGGMVNLKRYVEYIKVLEKVGDKKLKVKGILLVGIAGTGKSYSAKVVAGELDYYLVELNLSKIMETVNPIFTLHKIFSYLEKLSLESGYKFILWIDEIEKMFAEMSGIEKKVMGQLLTILNDLNTEEGYKINGIFWATANDIQQILEKNPEFVRSGRFDMLFFVDTPCYPNEAIDIFKIYFDEFNIPEFKNEDLWKKLVQLAQDNVWDELIRKYGGAEIRNFVYTPAEIMQLNKEVKRDILLFAEKLGYKDLKRLNENAEEIEMFLNQLYDILEKDPQEKLEEILKEHYLSYKKVGKFLKRNKEKLKEGFKYEKILLAMFYNEMFSVQPLLRSARDTIAFLRGLAREKFIPVSKCS
jgi:SpoVK/Ycf46/Vps4 family AAA+-type ATPase